MALVDCHSHVFMHPEKERILKSLENIYIIENGLDFETNRIVLEESKKYDNVFCAIGLHPTNVLRQPKEKLLDELNFIKNILEKKSNEVLAIGEVGLDYYWVRNEKLRSFQVNLFKKLLEIALEYNLPVIIHSRNSEKDIYNIIKSYEGIVVMHSYLGKHNIAKKLLDLDNVFFSIPSIVYRLNELQKLVELIPLKKILTETDTPFLSPIKRVKSEPRFVEYGIKKIAELKQVEIKEIEKVVEKNFRRVFFP